MFKRFVVGRLHVLDFRKSLDAYPKANNICTSSALMESGSSHTVRLSCLELSIMASYRGLLDKKAWGKRGTKAAVKLEYWRLNSGMFVSGVVGWPQGGPACGTVSLCVFPSVLSAHVGGISVSPCRHCVQLRLQKQNDIIEIERDYKRAILMFISTNQLHDCNVRISPDILLRWIILVSLNITSLMLFLRIFDILNVLITGYLLVKK